MEIEYRLSKADILTLTRYGLLQNPRRRNPVKVRRLAYLIAFTMLAAGNWMLSKDITLPFFFLVLGVALFFLYPSYFDWLLKRKVTLAYREEKMRASLGPRILRVDVDGIEEKSSFGETKMNWSAVDDVRITPLHTIISVHETPSIMIPKNQIITGNYQDFVQATQQFFDQSVRREDDRNGV